MNSIIVSYADGCDSDCLHLSNTFFAFLFRIFFVCLFPVENIVSYNIMVICIVNFFHYQYCSVCGVFGLLPRLTCSFQYIPSLFTTNALCMLRKSILSPMYFLPVLCVCVFCGRYFISRLALLFSSS